MQDKKFDGVIFIRLKISGLQIGGGGDFCNAAYLKV